MTDPSRSKAEAACFAVDENPFCVWEWDLAERNLEFVKGLDPTYFQYLAETSYRDIASANQQNAAVTLRTTYSHALEAFLAVLFATVQAPDCVPGWLTKYWPRDLRSLVEKTNGPGNVRNKLGLERVTWSTVAAVIHGADPSTGTPRSELGGHFGRLWGRFANDFVDAGQTSEYNSMKHGFRVRPGGFKLAVGTEPAYGVPPPQEDMQMVGSSQFGSAFFSVIELGGRGPHFRIQRRSRNWVPENLYHGCRLLTMSIQNIIAHLRVRAGESRQDVVMTAPSDPGYFNAPWALSTGAFDLSMDFPVGDEDIDPIGPDEILRVYAGASAEEDDDSSS